MKKYLLLLSFLEGASVMAAELMGAKMMAPFFGSSLYVWSAVMAITLGGLAAGYFAGGILSTKKNPEQWLYKVLVMAAALTALMPFTSKFSLSLFGYFSLLPAVSINAMLILFPPVFLMGTVSPLIIRNIATDGEHAGKAAGTVYAISTVGGILATFLFGFWIIPSFGLTYPAIATGIVLGILPAIELVKGKKLPAVLFLCACIFLAARTTSVKPVSSINVVHSGEGVLGQIMVLDFPNDVYYADSTKAGQTSRWLFVNRVSQTMDDPYADRSKGEERYFTYIYKLEQVLDTFSSNRRKMLLLGLGGGSVAKHFSEKGFSVTACELDPRIAQVAKEYFDLPENVNIHIDDARHFIKTCKKQFDVVIFDTFKGEETPSHILTTESLAEVKSLLRKDGMIFVNSFGFWEGEKGQGARSIYATLASTGMQTTAWPTGDDENQRNILFVASEKNYTTPAEALPSENLTDAIVLTDEYPRFEIINAKAALSWRRMAINTMRLDQNQRAIPVFE